MSTSQQAFDTHMQQQALFDSDPLNYVLFRSARRTLSVYVENNKVIVRAPKRAPLYWIEEFLVKKRDWIQSQLLLDHERQANKLQLNNGMRFTLAGDEMSLSVNIEPQRKLARFQLHNQLHSPLHSPLLSKQLAIYLPQTTQEETEYQLYRTFLRWVKSQAANELPQKTIAVAQQWGLNEQLGNIQFRQTKTKWGHCAANGDIQYNPLIMLAPLTVIDYLIAHEVAHLQHRNHSQRFWHMVEKIDPNYRESERWLRDEGYRLALELPPKP